MKTACVVRCGGGDYECERREIGESTTIFHAISSNKTHKIPGAGR
jgi:hypothetical protein